MVFKIKQNLLAKTNWNGEESLGCYGTMDQRPEALELPSLWLFGSGKTEKKQKRLE